MDTIKDSIRDYVSRPWRDVQAASESARDKEYQSGAASHWLQVSAELAHFVRERGNFDTVHRDEDLANHLRLRNAFDECYRYTQRLPR